ncbi:MAG: septum formation initiator family protein [Paracoccaceae bacterium]
MIAKRFGPRLADIGVMAVVIAATLYFAHRGVQGGLGLRVGFAAEKEERRMTAVLDEQLAERERLENLIRRLGENYLDLDLLDERARDILGRSRPDEMVIR